MKKVWICLFQMVLVGFLLGMHTGCSRQTECMKELSVKNCTELFDKCQQSQADMQTRMECTKCYNESCN